MHCFYKAVLYTQKNSDVRASLSMYLLILLLQYKEKNVLFFPLLKCIIENSLSIPEINLNAFPLMIQSNNRYLSQTEVEECFDRNVSAVYLFSLLDATFAL